VLQLVNQTSATNRVKDRKPLLAAVKPTDEKCHGNETHPTLRYIYLQQTDYEQKLLHN